MRENTFVFALLAVLILTLNPSKRSSAKLITIDEQTYITNVANLSSAADINEFFELQCSIYVDNVYSTYERFFFKLLAEFPKCRRVQQIKRIAVEIDKFLSVEDDFDRVLSFDQFAAKYTQLFDHLFEYDAEETLLAMNDYNELYLSNGVEDMLEYAYKTQMQKFVDYTGNGIREFLIVNRQYLNKPKMLEFKEVVDLFLETREFHEKREHLKIFLHKAKMYLNTE